MGVYDRLGIQPVINARGMNTMASGSLMRPETIAAMAEAAQAFVDMGELNKKAGEHVAKLIGVEAAHITSGAAGGLLLSAAACLAGTDPARIAQLPDTTGFPNEIVIQRCHRFQYNQALRVAGARLVEVGDHEGATRAEVEAAIGPNTAGLIYIVSPYLGSRAVSVAEMAEIAHARGLPLIVDAASTLPPASHLTRWTSQGADLVIYSGGKGIRGPQGSGLLLGRADLIAAAAANAAPNASVGRPSKVSKEDIIGLVDALERFLAEDHAAIWQRHVDESNAIIEALNGVPGVKAHLEDDSSVWTAPNVLVEIDQSLAGKTPDEAVLALRNGDPPIMTRVFQNRWLLVDSHNLRGDEYKTVGRRLREVLSAATPVPVPAVAR
ncbi:MAG: aminotransferase class V-fold PLP-dependent enzyme [Chloroflexota bacterium]